MTPTAELTHGTTVVTDGQSHYRSECECGWTSDWYLADDAAAEADGLDHTEIAVEPRPPLDRCVSLLLDLQEDLAELVIWLADNWTADLPAPSLARTSTGVADILDLAVHCVTDTELFEITGLLGEPPVERDSRRDEGDKQYFYVRRSFGRVTVTAWWWQL